LSPGTDCTSDNSAMLILIVYITYSLCETTALVRLPTILRSIHG